MDSLHSLLFEISNEDRSAILRELEEEAKNVTSISRKLDLTIQESSRHLSRLERVGLTERDPDGLHHLSRYGRLVLKMLPGIEFLTLQRDYFSGHSLDGIPLEFAYRLGDLLNSSLVDDVMVGFYNVDRMLERAEEYVLMMTDQYLMGTMPKVGNALDRGVRVMNIESRFCVPPVLPSNWSDSDTSQALQRGREKGLLDERVLDSLEVYLYMSEREVGTLAFPLPDGKFDYLGFTSDDERIRNWCKQLFEYYWGIAQKRDDLAANLNRWVKNRPKAREALLEMVSGKAYTRDGDVLRGLQEVGLVHRNKLTILGYIICDQFSEKSEEPYTEEAE